MVIFHSYVNVYQRVSHIYLPSYSSVNSYQSFDESPKKIATFLESRVLQHCVPGSSQGSQLVTIARYTNDTLW